MQHEHNIADMHLTTARVEMLISYFSLPSVNSTVFPSSWADLLLVAPDSKCFKKPHFSAELFLLQPKFLMFYMFPKLKDKVEGRGDCDAESQQRVCVGEHVHSHTRSRWHQRAQDQSNKDRTLSAPSSSPIKKHPGVQFML